MKRCSALIVLLLGAVSPAVQAAPALTASDGPALRLDLSARTRIVYETPPQSQHQPRSWADPALFERPVPDHRLALEFRRGDGERTARNLLRVQLSSGSVLHFRPRGGGLAVRWKLEY